LATLGRPEGDGGWSPERRMRELERRARAAAVDLDPAPAAPPPAAVAVEAPGGERLDLAAALAHARRDNRPLAEARRRLAIARQRVREARGRLLPATTGSGRYTWYTDPLTVQPSVGLGGGPGAFEIRDQELGTVTGTLTLPLDLTGEIRHALAAAQAGYRGEAARLWATTLEQDVVVIGAYYTVLEALRLRDVTAQTIALERQQLRNAQDRYDRGRLTKNELLVVQVRLRNEEHRLFQRELAIDEARWALNQATGLPVDAAAELVDVRARPALPRLEEALRTAYADNPALRALVEEQQRLEATATALARGRLPRLSGGGTVDYSTTDVLEPRRVGAGFIGFEWDLGTDTRREARIAEARVAADRNRLRIERELRELEQAVRSAHRAVAERLGALATAEAAVGQAEENLRIRQQQFDVGRATSEDVLDAEALLAAQRATLASALYQAQTRRAELQRLMGQSLDGLLAGR
jgi:outer membrane protein